MPESVLTQTIPLPAGGAGWLAAGFPEDALLDFAGFVVAAELDEAGVDELAGAVAAAEFVLDADEAAGCEVADDFVFLEEDLVEAELEAAGVNAGTDALELLASAEAFVDFDFLVLADFVPESEAVESALASVEEALVDLDFFEAADLELASAESVESAFADFFELVDLEPASAESVESAFAGFDFLELVDFVSAEAASPEDLVDFFVLAALVSLSDAVDLVFFGFDADESEADLSVASVELASVAFFFLVVFFVELAVESLVSVFCALIGTKLASPRLSPAETRKANTYFFSAVIPIPPQYCPVV
jgi:hypothetical protein